MCGESKSHHCFHAGSSIQNHLEEAVQGDPEALEVIPADCMRMNLLSLCGMSICMYIRDNLDPI